MSLTTLHENQLDECLAAADRPVLVEFSAAWCGPCHRLAAVLDQLADQWRDRLSVLALDVDDNEAAARHFEVMAVPTLILFVEGKPVRRLVGARGMAQLVRELAEVLPAAAGAPAGPPTGRGGFPG